MWVAVTLVAGLTACAIESTEEPETSEAGSMLRPPPDDPGCDATGFVICPAVPDAEIEYGPPGCGYATIQNAWRVCEAFCDVACVGHQY